MSAKRTTAFFWSLDSSPAGTGAGEPPAEREPAVRHPSAKYWIIENRALSAENRVFVVAEVIIEHFDGPYDQEIASVEL